MTKPSRAILRCNSAETFGGSTEPSGVCSVARRSAALRRVGLKLRMPSRARVPFIRLTQKLTKDLAAPWFLELWAIASTPAKAGRLRKSTVERLLKQHRIRRMDAETVLRILREPAIKVAEGVAEAASIHIRSLVARLGIVNRELREAERKLDELCTAVSEIEQTSG